MLIRSLALTSALALSLSGCTPYLARAIGFGDYCAANPQVCGLIGFILAGAALYHTGGSSYVMSVSDERLKTDIQFVATTDRGVRLYAFRYAGAEDRFVGPLAGELRRDPRFASAVRRGADGFLRVDMAVLELPVYNGAAMAQAGEAAARRARN